MAVTITQTDLKNALPDSSSTMHLSGLLKRVDVFRDQWGIPHINAENEHDVFFAQGFVTAQDRLWQMDADRHLALGRWSEWAGTSGVDQDRLLRAAGMGRTARLDYDVTSSEARAMLDAYAAGVNAFLDTTKSLPIEYTILEEKPDRWQPWHCLAVYKMRNTLLGTFEAKLFRTRLVRAIGPEKVAAILKGYPKGHLLSTPPGAVFEGPTLDGLELLSRIVEQLGRIDDDAFGSNGWSISGNFTRSGLPLIAGDSHRALDAPNVYYQGHLSCPEFSVIGFAVPGMPGALHFCHNAYVGWGMTHGGIDTQDLFIERFRDGGHEYAFRDAWLPASVNKETIHVRGAASVEMTITITHHGPVIAGEPQSGTAVAISDPGLIMGTPWPDAVRDVMRSKSVNELHESLRNWTDRVNNYAVADVHGNFGYLFAGKIPIRTETNGWQAVPGWTGEYEWQGYIPHEELPTAINPAVGYVVTCNQRVVGHEYPYYLGLTFSPEHRARRVQARLLELKAGQATVDDMATIHAERLSIPARILVSALDRVGLQDEDSVRAIERLRNWDYSIDRDLVEPTIYAKMRMKLTSWLAEQCLGDLAGDIFKGAAGGEEHVRHIVTEMLSALDVDDRAMLPEKHEWSNVLAQALQQAVVDLKQTLGNDMSTWQWGRVHGTRQRHLLSLVFPELAEHLDPPSIAAHGDGDTPLAGSYSLDDFTVTTGSVNRYIHDPSDWTKSLWIVPLGSSGHPGSSHYADQAVMWSNVQYIPQLWDWEQIRSDAESHQSLLPL